MILPDQIVLVCAALTMILVNLFRYDNTPKTFYSLSKFFIVLAILSVIGFHDFSNAYLSNNMYISLFKIIIYVLTLGWGYLSGKRFQSKNRPSYRFYVLIMLNLLGFSVALSASNLALAGGALGSVFLLNYFLLSLEKLPNRRYLCVALFFVAVLAVATGVLKHYIGSLGYREIEAYLSQENAADMANLSAAAVLGVILFMLAVAPFHFWYVDGVGSASLPVSGYIAIVPVYAYFGCLINLAVNAFYPIYIGWFDNVMLVFGCCSIFIGAITAQSEKNLRKIFAGSSLYCVGVLVISISEINAQSLLSGFTYLMIYSLAIFGVYTVFYGFRVKGEHLADIDDIKGISTQRPYLAAAMLIFMISIVGEPPLIGFLGKLSVVNHLVTEGLYLGAIVIVFAMLILGYAFLNIITKMYFEPRSNIFDEVDRGVYIVLTINIALTIISILNPKYLMNDIEAMLVAVL